MMSSAKKMGHLEGAVSGVDAEYLFEKGFTAPARDNGTVGMMTKTFTNDEYDVSVVVSKEVLSAFVTYADEEYDGTDPIEVDEFVVSFDKGYVSVAYAEMLAFVGSYVALNELVTV